LKRPEPPIRILIADDHPVIRKAVRSILELTPAFEVCGEVPDGAKAIEEAQKLKPDVVLLNVNMPVMGGLQAARRIKDVLPGLAIVVLSSDADQRLVDEAKKIGVRAYIAKTKAGEELVRTIEAAVKSGDFVLVR
jgi:DNA-binding NarL/FixJ family response regulator